MFNREYALIAASSLLTSGVLLFGNLNSASAHSPRYEWAGLACIGTCGFGGVCGFCLNVCLNGDSEDMRNECDEIVHGEGLMLGCNASSGDVDGQDCSPPQAVEDCGELDNRMTCHYGQVRE